MIEGHKRIERETLESTARDYHNLPIARFYASVFIMLCRFTIIVALFSFVISAITWLPDIDLRMSPFLHHRSIVTHSILLPGILFISLRRFAIARFILAIIFSAISVHLFADVLSPPVGYGQIWIPPKGFLGLGVFSPLFIFVNAILSIFIAAVISPRSIRCELIVGVILTGALYGFMNEDSAASAIFIVLMLLSIFILLLRRGAINETPWSALSELRGRRDGEINKNTEYKNAMKAVWQSETKIKKIYAQAKMVMIGIYTTFRWIVFHPKKALASLGSVAGIAVALYFIGASGEGLNDGVLEAVSNGVWKLHSSGGYMLSEGGKYVAGTLTQAPPQ